MRAKRAAALIALAGSSALGSVAEAKDWTQIYVGAGIGADVVSTDIDLSLLGLVNIGVDDVGTSGFGASLRIGADYQVNNWLVVGAFANVDWSQVETKFSLGAGGAGASLDLLGIDHAWTIGARAGLLVTPDTLSYLLIGYTEVAFSDITFAGLLPAFKVPDGHGVVVGSGFEHRLTSNVSLTGEYRASFLDEETLFSVPGLIDLSTETVLHTGRVGLAYRFGGGGDETAMTERLSSSWTGFYGGLGTGVSGVDGEIDVGTPLLPGLSASAEGLVGGDYGGTLMIGYDQRVAPNWVVGVFGAVDKTVQDPEVSVGAFGITAAAIELPMMDELYTVAARAGYLLESDTLVYGLVGYSWLDMTDLEIGFVGLPSMALKMPSFGGVTFGGGIETLIGSGFSLRAEYRYASMEEEALFTDPLLTATAEADVHTTRVLFNYRFDQP